MKESRFAKNYFDEWASDYDAAFEGAKEANLLQKLINRFYRRKTFGLRQRHLTSLVKNMQVSGKSVLDLGCGSGQLALELARKGAEVTGWDISGPMIQICRQKAGKQGLKNANFCVRDVTTSPLPSVDIIFCIAVIEYYREPSLILKKMFRHTKETLVLTDARFVWYRMVLRKILGRLKNFPVYYHSPQVVKNIAKEADFKLVKDIPLHSFRTYVFSHR